MNAERDTPAMVTVPRLIDAEQVAGILVISERHLGRLVHSGEFPKPIKIGACARWQASDVADYLERLRARREAKPRRRHV
jgi:predicted DNA-binding transcriptional regulator AlpA